MLDMLAIAGFCIFIIHVQELHATTSSFSKKKIHCSPNFKIVVFCMHFNTMWRFVGGSSIISLLYNMEVCGWSIYYISFVPCRRLWVEYLFIYSVSLLYHVEVWRGSAYYLFCTICKFVGGVPNYMYLFCTIYKFVGGTSIISFVRNFANACTVHVCMHTAYFGGTGHPLRGGAIDSVFIEVAHK